PAVDLPWSLSLSTSRRGELEKEAEAGGGEGPGNSRTLSRRPRPGSLWLPVLLSLMLHVVAFLCFACLTLGNSTEWAKILEQDTRVPEAEAEVCLRLLDLPGPRRSPAQAAAQREEHDLGQTMPVVLAPAPDYVSFRAAPLRPAF